MLKIKKGDVVQVMKGKDRGKKGKVLKVFSDTGRILVEGVNQAKKHKRQTRQDQAGGVITIELPVALANVMPYCKNCNRPARVGFSVLKDGSKARICRKCQETI